LSLYFVDSSEVGMEVTELAENARTAGTAVVKT